VCSNDFRRDLTRMIALRLCRRGGVGDLRRTPPPLSRRQLVLAIALTRPSRGVRHARSHWDRAHYRQSALGPATRTLGLTLRELVLRAVHRSPRAIEGALASPLGAGAAVSTLFRRYVALDTGDPELSAAGMRRNCEVRDVDVETDHAIDCGDRSRRTPRRGAGGHVGRRQHE
jgi:hypothetical protein